MFSYHRVFSIIFILNLGVFSVGSLWAQENEKKNNSFLSNQSNNENTNTIFRTNENITNVFNPFSTIFIFSLNAGINIFTLNEEELIDKYNLNDLRNTVSFTFHVKIGTVLQHHWMTTVVYGYSKREDYHYNDNYFSLNAKSLETQHYHYLQLEVEYFLWNYLNNNNISFGKGIGWLRKNIYLSTIDNLASGNNLSSSEELIKKNSFISTLSIKYYHRLRNTGIIYFGISYNLLLPTFENYPHFVLGIDVNLDLTPKQKNSSNPFFDKTTEADKPKKTKINTPKTKGGTKQENNRSTKDAFEGIKKK